MTCDNCGFIWQSADPVTGPVACSMCGQHICACGCGTDLGDHREDARFASRAHAMAHKRAEGATTPRAGASASRKANVPRTEHPLQEVRDTQEQFKAHWSETIYNAIVEILCRGPFHPDDLEPLGIPDEHRNLIGAQLGSLAKRRYTHKVGERASKNPRRKGAKDNIIEFTRLGRGTLAGVGAEGGDDARKDECLLSPPAVESGPDSGEKTTGASLHVPGGASPERIHAHSGEARPRFEEAA